jgi:hypothetical protein
VVTESNKFKRSEIQKAKEAKNHTTSPPKKFQPKSKRCTFSLTTNFMEHLFHFLRESKEHFLNKKFDRVVHIFLGNEACDADSFISSVLYGYLSANIKSSNNSNTLMLPLIPIPKSDLSLRTEIAFLLQKSGFTCWAEVLLFIDEFSIEVIHIHLCGSISFCRCCLTVTNRS